MLRERIASQPEVVRAIVLEYSLCCGVPRLAPPPAVVERVGRDHYEVGHLIDKSPR